MESCMRRIFFVCILAVLVTAGNLLALDWDDELVFRLYSAGFQKINSDTNGTVFKGILNSQVSTLALQKLAEKLSLSPKRILSNRIKSNDFNPQPEFYSIFYELLRSEFLIEFHGQTNRIPEFNVAVKLSPDRSGFWYTNLWIVIDRWSGTTPKKFKEKEADGWVAQVSDEWTFRFYRENGWTVFGWGHRDLAFQKLLIKQTKHLERALNGPSNLWFCFESDSKLLSQWLRHANLLDFPIDDRSFLKINAWGDGKNIRSAISINLEKPLKFEPAEFSVPTNIIKDPIVSFSAVQGIDGWLSNRKWFKELGIPAPKQLYLWANSGIPFATFAVMPMDRPIDVFRDVIFRITEVASNNLPALNVGDIYVSTNYPQAIWQGWPILVPCLKPVMLPNKKGYLIVGFSPGSTASNSLPGELLDQLKNQKKLIYYDWEITEERVRDWRFMLPLIEMSTTDLRKKKDAVQKIASDKVKNIIVMEPWLSQVLTNLGNTVTELRVVSDRQIKGMRKSQIGLTGFELVLLEKWLDSRDFPIPPLPPKNSKISKNRQ